MKPSERKAPRNRINIPPYNGGYFIFGHSPNTTGCAQVRLLLACQPCNCCLLPVNGFALIFCRGRRPRRPAKPNGFYLPLTIQKTKRIYHANRQEITASSRGVEDVAPYGVVYSRFVTTQWDGNRTPSRNGPTLYHASMNESNLFLYRQSLF